jgi:peptide deformylase
MALQITTNYRKPFRGILQEPDERLRMVSKKVDKIDNKVVEAADQLIIILKKINKPYNPWLGMAAPQLGINLRVIVIKKGLDKYQVMINPEFNEQKFFLPTISGCYSLKGLYLFNSPYWVKVNYLDLKGKNHVETYFGGQAILLKQEIDHLNGRLVCD